MSSRADCPRHCRAGEDPADCDGDQTAPQPSSPSSILRSRAISPGTFDATRQRRAKKVVCAGSVSSFSIRTRSSSGPPDSHSSRRRRTASPARRCHLPGIAQRHPLPVIHEPGRRFIDLAQPPAPLAPQRIGNPGRDGDRFKAVLCQSPRCPPGDGHQWPVISALDHLIRRRDRVWPPALPNPPELTSAGLMSRGNDLSRPMRMLVHQETRGLVASALIIVGGGPAYAALASSRITRPTVTSGRFWYSVRPGARPSAAGITAATFTGRGAYPRA